MKIIVRITDEEYTRCIKQSGAKSEAEVKIFIANLLNMNHAFELRVYKEDAYEFEVSPKKEFVSRICKFRSPINCDFCAFHSDCDEHWKEGKTE